MTISNWVAALEVANVGDRPWGPVNSRQVTLSPVLAADPFCGRFSLPPSVAPAKCRVCLEMDGLPDDSAAIRVNGVFAGGVIGRPLRLDITHWLRAGENTLVIEPLAPKSAHIILYRDPDPGKLR